MTKEKHRDKKDERALCIQRSNKLIDDTKSYILENQYSILLQLVEIRILFRIRFSFGKIGKIRNYTQPPSIIASIKLLPHSLNIDFLMLHMAKK